MNGLNPNLLETIQWGDVSVEYRVRPFNRMGGIWIMLIVILLIVISRQFAESLVVLGIIGQILVPFGSILMMHGWGHRNTSVKIYRDGIVINLKRQTPIAIAWKTLFAFIKMRNILIIIPTGFTYEYILVTDKGQMLVLDATFNKIYDLGETVIRNTPKYPAYKNSFALDCLASSF